MAEKGIALDQGRPIEEYASTMDWLESLNSEYTKTSFKSHIRKLLAFINSERAENAKLTPDDLLKMTPQEHRVILFKYALHLKKVAVRTAGKKKPGEISVNSLPTLFIGIRSFLDYHEIPTAYWKKLVKVLPPKVTNNLRGYTHEEIAKMIELGDVFDRANIVLFKGGGERVGAQEDLRLSDLERLEEFDMGLLHVYRDSASAAYDVPLSKEDLYYIDAMLDYRKKHGERLTPDSPLIRHKFGPFSSRTNRVKPAKRDAIRVRMRNLARKAGLDTTILQPDHSFRYFFDTCLMNSDCKWEIKELMMGHSVKLDKFYYDKKNPESRRKLFVEYMKAVDSLTVMPQFKMTKKIKELEKQVEKAPQLEALQNSLVNKELEMDAVKKRMLEQEQQMSQMHSKFEEFMKEFMEAQRIQNDPVFKKRLEEAEKKLQNSHKP